MNALPNLDPYFAARSRMVEEQICARGIKDERVLAAMRRVPRHEFVPAYQAALAYEDHPIGIAENQTISQPFMVASMLEHAEIKPADVVLEVGTGSGYQTAVLAELAAEVFSVERFASLADTAQSTLAHMNYANVVITTGDGSLGLPSAAPFDAIIVAAASPEIPQPLVEQLREGGRLVIPVGGAESQELYVVRKVNGMAHSQRFYGCKFVPLIGRHGQRP
ncbi:MAG TPA: protein-L-isoaspartate(D-aspartate) O-methyltransferase [Terriglobales bacterium]|nr:protein-L-isoaspartate(D-aspartate) O-methyltransferase [Terriglobales bacterium]